MPCAGSSRASSSLVRSRARAKSFSRIASAASAVSTSTLRSLIACVGMRADALQQRLGAVDAVGPLVQHRQSRDRRGIRGVQRVGVEHLFRFADASDMDQEHRQVVPQVALQCRPCLGWGNQVRGATGVSAFEARGCCIDPCLDGLRMVVDRIEESMPGVAEPAHVQQQQPVVEQRLQRRREPVRAPWQRLLRLRNTARGVAACSRGWPNARGCPVERRPGRETRPRPPGYGPRRARRSPATSSMPRRRASTTTPPCNGRRIRRNGRPGMRRAAASSWGWFIGIVK